MLTDLCIHIMKCHSLCQSRQWNFFFIVFLSRFILFQELFFRSFPSILQDGLSGSCKKDTITFQFSLNALNFMYLSCGAKEAHGNQG